MAGRSEPAVNTADRELVVSRVFDAPRELVFDVWTDPKHITHWWGPRGFSTTTREMDVSPGGVWRFVMHGPDGRDYKNRIVFTEVVKPERLVYLHGDEDESEPVNFQSTILFDDEAGKTRLTLRMVFPTAEERDRVVKEYGAEQGAVETLDRLGEYLAKQ